MKTYGVSFEGFEPLCGWPLYWHVENKHSSRKVTPLTADVAGMNLTESGI